MKTLFLLASILCISSSAFATPSPVTLSPTLIYAFDQVITSNASAGVLPFSFELKEDLYKNRCGLKGIQCQYTGYFTLDLLSLPEGAGPIEFYLGKPGARPLFHTELTEVGQTVSWSITKWGIATQPVNAIGRNSSANFGLLAPAPEPATWLLFVTGLGLIGVAACRAARAQLVPHAGATSLS